MSIPKYDELMLPLLHILADGQEHSMRECIELLAQEFRLSKEELAELLPSGQQSVFYNRLGWARTYLKKAGLLRSPRRGFIQITERGRWALSQNLEAIDIDFLLQFEEFRQFRENSRAGRKLAATMEDSIDPVEQMEAAYGEYEDNLANELLTNVAELSAAGFERLVVRLLVQMGYGGGLKEAAKVVGRSNDGGIDGLINEDPLGLDVLYIQAKQWTNPVGRPEIQKFVGALHGQRARKGVFITTSIFTKEATDYANKIEPKVVLIDGDKLVRLMIKYNLGVFVRSIYEIKGVDTDFFEGLS